MTTRIPHPFGSIELIPTRRARRRRTDALRLLQDVGAHATAMGQLRELALTNGAHPEHLDDHELIGAVASLIDDGTIALTRQHRGGIGSTLLPHDGQDAESATEGGERASTALDWIRIKLIDQKGRPVAAEIYEIGLPDGSIRKGRLDENGLAELRGIPNGECDVTFPRLSKRLWGPA